MGQTHKIILSSNQTNIMKLLLSALAALAWMSTMSYAQPDYDIEFATVDAIFDDSNEQDQITLTYTANTAPTGGRSYTHTVFQSPGGCTTVDESIISPGATNTYAGSTLTATLDVDTTLLMADANFWTGAGDDKSGTIAFCVKSSLLNDGGFAIASEMTAITITVDITKGFTVMGITYINEADNTGADADAILDYSLTVFFCDGANTEITPAGAFLPGTALSFCVKATSVDASVDNLHSVEWKNLDTSIVIELVDADSVQQQGETTVTCGSGICRVDTVVYEVLYESISGGALVVDFDNLQLSGTAMMIFTRRGLTRGGTRMLQSSSIGGAEQEFELEFLVAESESGASSSSFAFTAFMMVVGMVGSFLVV